MLSFRKKLMSQSQENFQTEGRKDGKMEIWKDEKTKGGKDGRMDRQTLIHRILLVTARGSSSTTAVDHI